MKIGRVCMYVEIDGKPCVVALPQVRMRMLIDLAARLSDDGKLPVMHAPEGTYFIRADSGEVPA